MLKPNFETLLKSFLAPASAAAMTIALLASAGAQADQKKGGVQNLPQPEFTTGYADDEDEGTERKLLSERDRAALREFANSSKAQLEKALRQADGGTVQERVAIYVSAICDVRSASKKMNSGSELLMRFALNQGLDLTYGTGCGRKLGKRPGVLQGSRHDVLMAKILKDSIDLAISYYQDDRKAIESGMLLELPFNRFSAERLKIARERWIPVVGDNWRLAYDLQVALLYQWMNAANHEQNSERHLLADELYQTNDILASLPPPPERPTLDEQELAGIVRGKLREHTAWLEKSLAQKLVTPTPRAAEETAKTE